MDLDLNLLVISHSFPPSVEVGGRRVERFCRYLPEFGIRPTVLTIQDRFREAVDPTATPVIGYQIERTEMKQMPINLYRRAKARFCTIGGPVRQHAASPEPRKGLTRRQIAKLLQFPGQEWGWYRPAVQAAKRLIRDQSVDAVLSSSPPEVAHRIALRLKKDCGVSWLADFRDPWAHRPYSDDEIACWRYTNRLLESKCVRAADRVICNTNWLRQDFIRFYPEIPAGNFVTVTNGFDNSSPALERKAGLRSRLLLLHLGSIYALRRIDTFCKAVDALVKAEKINPAAFSIVFLGHIDPSLETAARLAAPDLFLKGCIEFKAPVTRERAQQALSEADILLLFQGSHHVQIPAKFYEYLPTGRPIFAVAQRGALTDMLEETGAGIWADPENAQEIAAQFLQVLSLPGLSPMEAHHRWYGRFHYRSLAEKLAWSVRSAVAVRAAAPILT